MNIDSKSAARGLGEPTAAGVLSRLYRWIAVGAVGALLLFAAINLLVYWAGSRTNASFQSINGQPRYSLEFLKSLYPGRSEQEIHALIVPKHGLGLAYEPWIEVKTEPGITADAGVHEAGFRFVGGDQGPWPPALDAFNIFVFGGSAVAGPGLDDSATIPAAIQRIARQLRPELPINVYNFGTREHYSEQTRLYLEHLLMQGIRPTVAIFVDGYSDFYQWRGEPESADWLRTSFVTSQAARSVFTGTMEHTEVSWYLRRGLTQLPIVRSFAGNEEIRAEDASGDAGAKDIGKIKDVIDRYLRNKLMVEAITKESRVTPIFVWLPRVPVQATGEWRRAYYGYAAVEDVFDKGAFGANFVMCRNNEGLYYPPVESKSDGPKLFQRDLHLLNGFGAYFVAQCVVNFLNSKQLLPEKQPPKPNDGG